MIDIIGTLYTPGVYGAEMAVIKDPVALPGYHVNTPEPVEAWAAFAVTPATPRRVFAGAPTHCYTFADEAEFIAQRKAAGLEPLEDTNGKSTSI